LENNFNLRDFIDAIEDLERAKELLEEIWNELGPYNGVLSDHLRYKLNNYMKFDDSE
jgi:hypothetical protein